MVHVAEDAGDMETIEAIVTGTSQAFLDGSHMALNIIQLTALTCFEL